MPDLAGNYSGFFSGRAGPRSYVLDDPVIGLAKRAFFGVAGPESGDLDCRTPSDGRPAACHALSIRRGWDGAGGFGQPNRNAPAPGRRGLPNKAG